MSKSQEQARLTTKLPGYKGTAFPEETESPDIAFHRQLLTEIIFGLWNKRKEELAKRGWPPQPVHQRAIFEEYKARVQRYQEYDKKLGLKGKDRYWPFFAIFHDDHNWVERRVNYLATKEYGPKTENGTLKIVNTTAGYYQPNPVLFTKGEKQ